MFVRFKLRDLHGRSNRTVVGCNETEAVYKKRHLATKRRFRLVRVRESRPRAGA